MGEKVVGGGGGGGMNWEIGIDMYTLMCIKWMTNQNLLYKRINKIKFKKKKRREGGGGEGGVAINGQLEKTLVAMEMFGSYVNILLMMLYKSFARCSHWRKLSKGH